VALEVGEQLVIYLPENASTGYTWVVESANEHLGKDSKFEVIEETYKAGTSVSDSLQ
jgi:predicted secreted protein